MEIAEYFSLLTDNVDINFFKLHFTHTIQQFPSLLYLIDNLTCYENLSEAISKLKTESKVND